MIDTHAHLYLCKETPEILFKRAQKAGISHIINVAINLETATTTLNTHKKHPTILPTIGIYPGEPYSQDTLNQVEEEAKKHPYVAIGEIGLDYHWMKAPKPTQIQAFEYQLDIANRLHLPVIIHNRDSEDDMIAITTQYPKLKKVFHCYGSPIEFANAVMDDHTYVSFTGTITYSKKGKTIQALKQLPLNRIMIETDCPYLTPKAHQGNKNESAFVVEIAKKIAEVKQLELETVLEATTQNAIEFFNINIT